MSKSSQEALASAIPLNRADLVSSSLDMFEQLTRCAVSRSKAAPYGALRSAGRAFASSRNSFCYFARKAMVEPIGIEPMT